MEPRPRRRDLGRPEVDPHGDPIPKADGSLAVVENRPLTACEVGFPFRLARVVDQSPDFLRFLSESGLGLGAVGQVTANHAAAGVVSIRIDGRETTLGREVAEKLLVTPAAATP